MNFIYRLVLTSFITMLVLLPCANGQESITLGDERSDVYIPLLKGKRVGLFSNQSGIVKVYFLLPGVALMIKAH